MSERPAHHGPDGKYRTPWPLETSDQRGGGGVLRWQMERLRTKLPPTPPASAFPLVAGDVARPHADPGEIRITWIGHASFLLQIGRRNVLLDPHFGSRASPFRFMGPKRFGPPGLALDALPPIDAVLLSHDHYDHLDEWSVRQLHRRFGDAIRWIAPLGHEAWLRARGIRNVADVDWWDAVDLPGADGALTVTCAPAQHWTRRKLREFNDRLWGSFALRTAGGRSVYFGGDSGYFRGYAEIGERLGPFDAVLMPIGAYEPRWFMAPAHMNPEEAVRAYRELGGRGAFVPMHWGTFRLTDEDPLEPPVRIRGAWTDAGLPPDDLHVLKHGETLIIQ
ncbi:MBL fold metallo-hydrolase [Longimicrobium sp.]|uniref:MBL fold metallo-hydrolase n=1 Tax=Longimicrobium sp. TaxID=2029185 RepID=UPI003B3BE27C